MPQKFEKLLIAPEDDKRIKLSKEDKEEIRYQYFEVGGTSLRKLAKEYEVTKGAITYALYPERREHNYALRVARGGSKQYYDKDLNNAYSKKHREYKKELYNEGKLLEK